MLSGKTALVTGGARGIGRAITDALSAAGARVVITGRREAEINAAAAATGGIGIVADLSTRSGVTDLLATITRKVGRIDILVNNAGVAESAPYDRTSDDNWDRTLELNVTVPVLLCRALVPPMVKAGWGRVINVASNAGRIGYAYTMSYCASKHALVGLTRSLAAEIAKSGVTVNAVCPGWVRTDMAAEAAARIAEKTRRSASDAEATLAAMSPQNRLMEADEVAQLVVMLTTEGARGIHGQAIPVDGGQVMA
ncbi:MAG: SDR family oxidoreductase [Polyangiaceae bacterium]|nr:SDR family oxidoreductase [Polyangiaceae bacterium]